MSTHQRLDEGIYTSPVIIMLAMLAGQRWLYRADFRLYPVVTVHVEQRFGIPPVSAEGLQMAHPLSASTKPEEEPANLLDCVERLLDHAMAVGQVHVTMTWPTPRLDSDLERNAYISLGARYHISVPIKLIQEWDLVRDPYVYLEYSIAADKYPHMWEETRIGDVRGVGLQMSKVY